MEVNNQTAGEATVDTQSTQVTETPPASTAQVSQQETPSGDKPADVYTPNYKYKSYDNEYEFDEYMKPLVTNKQVEERLRELYAAQRGIEGVSKARDKAQSEYTEYKKQWSPVLDLVQKANKAYQSKDYDLFFKTLGVPEKEVLQYAYKRLEYMDMPQDKRAQHDQDIQLKREYHSSKEENELLKEQFQEFQKQKLSSDIDMALSNQEVAPVIKAFEERNGQGSFKEEVIARGIYIYQTTGKSPTPNEVVKDLVNKYGLIQQNKPVNNVQTPAESNVVQRKDVPVMKSPTGGGSSVAGKAIKSLDDLKAVRKEKYGF